MQVFGPHGEAHYAVQRQRQGTFTAMAQASGLYRVCFSNRMSTLTEKTVAFSLHTGDELYRDVAKKEHISPLENEITQLADAVTAVEDEQKFLWARERAARDSELALDEQHGTCLQRLGLGLFREHVAIICIAELYCQSCCSFPSCTLLVLQLTRAQTLASFGFQFLSFLLFLPWALGRSCPCAHILSARHGCKQVQ